MADKSSPSTSSSSSRGNTNTTPSPGASAGPTTGTMNTTAPVPISNPNTSSGMPAASPNSHQRHSSIVDMLSTPPPLSSSADSRRLSTASQNSQSDESAISSTPPARDWQDVPLTDLVQKDKLLSVDCNVSVERAFEVLEANDFTSIPIKYKNSQDHDDNTDLQTAEEFKKGSVDVSGVSHTFDYADLNAYLLLVLGHIEPIEQSNDIKEAVLKAKAGKEVPVKFVAQLGMKDPFVKTPASSSLSTAVEILGKGVHRIAVTDAKDPGALIGVLSQRRVIRYIWENGRLFKSLEPLFQMTLKELDIGSTKIICIGGDELVIDALQKMHHEGVSSLAVVDPQNVLLGNISVVDVKYLTKSSQAQLLRNTCKQFLTVILSKRGLVDGKDSFPVFHVTSESTLGRTIAKLVATRAHRLWIVQKPSDTQQPPMGSGGPLEGVISLTDILYLLAKRAGKAGIDPEFARKQRRRSSSSSVRSPAIDVLRRPSDSKPRG